LYRIDKVIAKIFNTVLLTYSIHYTSLQSLK